MKKKQYILPTCEVILLNARRSLLSASLGDGPLPEGGMGNGQEVSTGTADGRWGDFDDED